MSKQDWLWVAIRIFGIYLLVMAVAHISAALASAWSVWFFWDLLSGPPLEAGELTKSMGVMMKSQVSVLIGNVLYVIICGLAGLYMVVRGQFLFRLVNPPGDAVQGPGHGMDAH